MLDLVDRLRASSADGKVHVRELNEVIDVAGWLLPAYGTFDLSLTMSRQHILGFKCTPPLYVG